MPTIAMIATAVQASRPKIFVMPSSSRCSGERTRLVAVTMSAMRPICVAWPVSVTTKLAVPRVTCVFWNTRFVRSPSAVSPAGSVARSLATGALSPVSAASWSSSVAETTTRPSAGHDVTRLEQHDVAGNEVDRLDLLDAARSPHPRVRHLEPGERLDTRPRLQLLSRSHHDVERHEQRDEDPGRDLADRDARDRDDRSA